MRRNLLKKRLKRIIAEVAIDPTEKHRCLDGSFVTLENPRCVEDLQFRIQDATEDRDACRTRTDARVHYNGLLNVLRRKLRQAKKVQPEDHI